MTAHRGLYIPCLGHKFHTLKRILGRRKQWNFWAYLIVQLFCVLHKEVENRAQCTVKHLRGYRDGRISSGEGFILWYCSALKPLALPDSAPWSSLTRISNCNCNWCQRATFEYLAAIYSSQTVRMNHARQLAVAFISNLVAYNSNIYDILDTFINICIYIFICFWRCLETGPLERWFLLSWSSPSR